MTKSSGIARSRCSVKSSIPVRRDGRWRCRGMIYLLLACPAFGQSSCGDSAAQEPAMQWVIPSDHPDLKLILRLNGLRAYYRFDFWNRGDAPVITNEQLLEAITLVTGATK
jgi:hypothetical protein